MKNEKLGKDRVDIAPQIIKSHNIFHLSSFIFHQLYITFDGK